MLVIFVSEWSHYLFKYVSVCTVCNKEHPCVIVHVNWYINVCQCVLCILNSLSCLLCLMSCSKVQRCEPGSCMLLPVPSSAAIIRPLVSLQKRQIASPGITVSSHSPLHPLHDDTPRNRYLLTLFTFPKSPSLCPCALYGTP